MKTNNERKSVVPQGSIPGPIIIHLTDEKKPWGALRVTHPDGKVAHSKAVVSCLSRAVGIT